MTEQAPPWLRTARALIGTDEYAGGADNPIIIGWAREIGLIYPEMAAYSALYQDDAIKWCGLLVAICCARHGIRPPFGPADTDQFLWAQAWKQVAGTRLHVPQIGAILVFPRHVTFFDGDAGDGYWWCVGGNQSDSVTRARYRAADCEVIIWPEAIAMTQLTKRFTGITATVFGGHAEQERSAYDNHLISEDEFGVALPYRFKGERPDVRVHANGRSVVCAVVDVGPWNTDDPYWESGRRPQAESGVDRSGRSTNLAGIDLTPAAARAIGVSGKGKVDWEFVGGEESDVVAPADNPELDACLRDIISAVRPILERHMAPVPAPQSQPDMLDMLRQLLEQRTATPPAPTLSSIDAVLGGQGMVGKKTVAGLIGLVGTVLGGQFGGLDGSLYQIAVAGFGFFTAVGLVAKIDRGLVLAKTIVDALRKLQPPTS